MVITVKGMGGQKAIIVDDETVIRFLPDASKYPGDIEYREWCDDCRRGASSRPFIVRSTGRAYASPESAAMAIIGNAETTSMPTEAQFKAALGPCGK